ncbi:MAG: aminoacetone oxidase family FAD-binding enzyme, partial [Clostridia bacterium]|nr:aminoacetone oxidase family FAD-binding enzyme [Clostridia bacterium]
MKVIIVGGGASGLICAIESARQGCQVTIIEHNEKVGKKIYITGKGRCNLTNLCSPSVFLTNVVTNSKFLYSSINVFSPQDTIEYFNKLGLLTVVERGQRVFPSSQKASDVTSALMREINRLGVTVLLNSDVQCINVAGNVVKSLTVLHKSASLSNNMTDIVVCDRLVLATGGRSYPTTGSNGSGYALAQSVGHNIIKCKPSLVGILANDCAQ